MDPRMKLIFILSLFVHLLCMEAKGHPPRPSSKIAVMGFVYCDACSNNTFSRHSYFLPGARVHLNCKFNANSESTREQITFSVNRTTDKYGMYKLEIPSIDGIKCAEGVSVQSFCQASLIRSSSSSCNVPGLKTTSDQMAIKSKKGDTCFYTLNALNYRPPKRDIKLCGEHQEGTSDPLNSVKTFFPFWPPFRFPWPPFPQFPPLPPFPAFPFPTYPFLLPPLPPLQFPPLPLVQPPPPPPPPPPQLLPFPFPPLPPLPSLPPLPPLPPLPQIPYIFAPPPPAFNLLDPRTWPPFGPPSHPSQQQDQHP